MDQAEAVVSILGRSDKLPFPDVGSRKVLQLNFDDVAISSSAFVAPSHRQIGELIDFGKAWNAASTLLIHCRAGSARSPAAAMIIAAALARTDSAALAKQLRLARAYFRPNEAMLKLADELISPCPGLVDMNRSVPLPTHVDAWKPVRLPLTANTDT